jgi:hypothetical protein
MSVTTVLVTTVSVTMGLSPLCSSMLCYTSTLCYSLTLCSSRTLRPTLPPKQGLEYQVQFGGEIRLACGSGPGTGSYHQQATFRKRLQIPAGQMAEPAPHLITYHSATHGATYHKSDPGRLIGGRCGLDQQVPGDQLPSGTTAMTHHMAEL